MLKIGIIGVGRMGTTHSRNIESIPGTRVTGIYDLEQKQIDTYLAAFPGRKVYSSAVELASSPEVDFVLVTSPSYCHIEGIWAATSAGKPVFCEKPLCRTQAQLDELTPLLRNYQKLFAVGFVRRYSPGVIRMKQMLDAGKIGRPLCFEVHVMLGAYKRMPGDWFADYSLCGGVTLDMLAHHADLLNYFVGEAQSVCANALMLNPKNGLPADYLSATVTCKNGVIGTIQGAWLRSGPSENGMIIYGDQGALRLSDQTGITYFTPGNQEEIPLDDQSVVDLQNLKGGMFGAEMAVLVDCVRKGEKPWAGVEEALAAQQLCLALMRSAERREIVYLP
ncbi:MAG: Gfo/Idh/MocA family oxidoreductase [Oligosphaeraceae bacterium]|nr:Gfo/Idh/MocA family oxidoreductase [Oligosphaeraceae bacterium]